MQQCLQLGGMSERLIVIFDHLMKGVNAVFSNLPEATDHAGEFSTLSVTVHFDSALLC